MRNLSRMPPRPQPRAMTIPQLRKLMRAAGVETQAELARRLRVHKVTVWRWFKGDTPISAPVAALIRETLKVND